MDSALTAGFGSNDLQALATATVVVLLALAMREDLLRKRISNVLNLSGLVLGLGLMFIGQGPRGLVVSVGGALIGCAALLPFYLLRGMGAGDVKLMAAAGAFLGPGSALLAAALALVAGSVLAIAIVAWRLGELYLRPEASPAGGALAGWRAATTLSIVRKERFPYAIAIAVGVLATLGLQGSLGRLFAALGIG